MTFGEPFNGVSTMRLSFADFWIVDFGAIYF